MAPVWVYVYELSEGLVHLATSFSDTPRVKGIWHSAIVVHNKEIEFGRKGIICTDIGVSGFTLVKKYYLGNTDVSLEILLAYLRFLNSTKFKAENYNVLTFNCNVFANFLANELVKKNIPQYLLDLPKDVALSAAGCLFKVVTKIDLSSVLSSLVKRENIHYYNRK